VDGAVRVSQRSSVWTAKLETGPGICRDNNHPLMKSEDKSL